MSLQPAPISMKGQIKTDIAVVGSGIAGFAAAIGAAETGARVVIVEAGSQLGGNATQANVGTVCGAFYSGHAGNLRPVGYDFTVSLVSLLCHQSGTVPLVQENGLVVVPYEWTALQNIMAQQLQERKIRVLTQARLIHTEKSDDNISRLIMAQANGQVEIKPNAVIDCSGNGAVSDLSGLEMIREKSYQAASQVFRVRAVQCPGEYQLEMAIKRAVARLTQANQWPESQPCLTVVPGSLRNQHVDLKLTMPDLITDDPLANESIRGRAHLCIQMLFPVLHDTVNYLYGSTIHSIFPQLGIRVVNRSKGGYVLTKEDVIEGKKFSDAVAVGTWPIEEWKYDGSVVLEFSESADGYDIPASCLRSAAMRNLHFAGKNISASTDAIGSARVMGTCMQTGYAVGRIASGHTPIEQQRIIRELNHALAQHRI